MSQICDANRYWCQRSVTPIATRVIDLRRLNPEVSQICDTKSYSDDTNANSDGDKADKNNGHNDKSQNDKRNENDTNDSDNGNNEKYR